MGLCSLMFEDKEEEEEHFKCKDDVEWSFKLCSKVVISNKR